MYMYFFTCYKLELKHVYDTATSMTKLFLRQKMSLKTLLTPLWHSLHNRTCSTFKQYQLSQPTMKALWFNLAEVGYTGRALCRLADSKQMHLKAHMQSIPNAPPSVISHHSKNHYPYFCGGTLTTNHWPCPISVMSTIGMLVNNLLLDRTTSSFAMYFRCLLGGSI